ncbi:MAG TPA: 50S ribosomal protein L3 N(5)-glutamine methyltransferase, partial [Xanthobacteraceae bacterium]|nr:50S ribosomal protein L3 N(5)-glutamine methyltransferase [Xanthobacteraceae bacterium]
AEAPRHLGGAGGLLCEVGRTRDAVARAFSKTPFLWLDTEESSGEVFWLDAKGL